MMCQFWPTEGDVCLSILRTSSVGNDGMGWAPTRRLKDVIWGLNSLFTGMSKNIIFSNDIITTRSNFLQKTISLCTFI